MQAELAIDGDFVVLNGDRIVEPAAISALMEAPQESHDPVMAVAGHPRSENYSTVELDGRKVRPIEEKPPAYTVTTDYINAGVFSLGKAIFDDLRAAKAEGVLAVTAVLREYRDGLRAAPSTGSGSTSRTTGTSSR
ncbi:sugar phosphate nucleotidyltransferase [Halobellus inordinatus]|uniref:sugar phosphate nucleotidyltransferase n=1 Tax=Halobellus inordinatus TaxID=1126236 RepID=UPI00211554D9|nr:sugar phosphate nucleotidyltransferase [Halobellus ramosii]